jgi:hypothetical protein
MHSAPIPSPATINSYLEGSPFTAQLAERLAQRNPAHRAAVLFNRCCAHSVPCSMVVVPFGAFEVDGMLIHASTEDHEVVAVQLAIALGY